MCLLNDTMRDNDLCSKHNLHLFTDKCSPYTEFNLFLRLNFELVKF